MNEFTKEELKDLLWSIRFVKEKTTNRSDCMSALRTKLLTLIANYCEHEPSDAHYEQFRWQSCHKEANKRLKNERSD